MTCFFATAFWKKRRVCSSGTSASAHDTPIPTLMGTITQDLPDLHVVRDPNDDMIVAVAVAAGAEYVVTRDKDLLSLCQHEGIVMIEPEAFLHVLRGSR
jgi:predicted nucleic acid-binding protein